MTIINQKSISGITSITFASTSDDLLTFHSNNGTKDSVLIIVQH